MKTNHRWAWLLMLTVLVVGCKKEKEGAEGEAEAKGKKTKGKLSSREIPEAKAPADSAEEAAQRMLDGISNNQLELVWDALPESYQNDVTALVQKFGKKMDEDLWERSMGLVSQGVKVLKTKKDFILNHPELAPLMAGEGVDKKEISEQWVAVTDVLGALFSSELKDLDTLREFDGRQFFGGPMNETVKKISQAAEELGGEQVSSLKQVKVTKVSEDGDTALLKIEAPGKPTEEVGYSKVEGKWIPSKLAAGWTEAVQNMNQQIESITPEMVDQLKLQAVPLLQQGEAMMTQLENTSSQDEFNKLVAGPVMLAKLALQSRFGGNQTGPGPAAQPYIVIFSADLGQETADAFTDELLERLNTAAPDSLLGAEIDVAENTNTEITIDGATDFEAFSKAVTALVEEKKIGKVTDSDEKLFEVTVEVTNEAEPKPEEEKPKEAEPNPPKENTDAPTEKPAEKPAEAPAETKDN